MELRVRSSVMENSMFEAQAVTWPDRKWQKIALHLQVAALA